MGYIETPFSSISEGWGKMGFVSTGQVDFAEKAYLLVSRGMEVRE